MPPIARSAESFSSRLRGYASTGSSSHISSAFIVVGWKRCYCGNREVLATSQTSRNRGRMFWGCPNWKRGGGNHCDHFRWGDVIEGGIDEVVAEATDEHKKKITKLSKKVIGEKRKTKFATFLAIMSWVLTFCVGMLLTVKCSLCKG